MVDTDNYQDLVLKLVRERPHRKVRANRFRESIDTTILGVLSISVGLIVLIWLFMGSVRDPRLGLPGPRSAIKASTRFRRSSAPSPPSWANAWELPALFSHEPEGGCCLRSACSEPYSACFTCLFSRQSSGFCARPSHSCQCCISALGLSRR